MLYQAEELLASRGWFRGIWSSNEEKTETAVKRYKSAGDNLRKYDRSERAVIDLLPQCRADLKQI